jgi:hypothetical protein
MPAPQPAASSVPAAPAPPPAAPASNLPAGHKPPNHYSGEFGEVEGGSNQNPFGNAKSLDFTGGDDPNAKTVRLRERLNEAEVEKRKAEEEADARERAAEIRREERLKKIKYMQEMPDSTPAGTGKCFYYSVCFFFVSIVFC